MPGLHFVKKVIALCQKQRIFAMSPVALTQAQASRHVLAREYRDASVIRADGILRTIERVEILGPWGESQLCHALSRLTDGWRIQVHLSKPRTADLEDLKELLSRYVSVNGGVHGGETGEEPPKAVLAAAIRRAQSVAEIFEVLRVPAPSDA